MKVKKIILRDSSDNLYDDLITFDNEVNLIEVIAIIERVKQKEEYTNEDIYKELTKLSDYELEWIGQLKVIEY